MEIAINKKNSECVIKLGHGHVLKLDRRDLKAFAEKTWYVSTTKSGSHYLKTNIRLASGKKTTREFHRYIIGDPGPGLEIDHINGDGLDNRRSNLRCVSHLINRNNSLRRTDKWGNRPVGCYFDKVRKLWIVQVTFNGVKKTVGTTKTVAEAGKMFNDYVLKHGLPKRLNIL